MSGRATVTEAKRPNRAVDFRRTPHIVIWEITRACDLRCRHCRADARPDRHPLELTTAEGVALLDQIHELDSPVFVLTGGDPLKRPDLFTLLAHAERLGVPVAVTPSATPLLTPDAIRRMRDLGVQRLAISLDGWRPQVHERLRGEPGSYAWTLTGIRAAVACGLPVQINTTATRYNLEGLGAIARMVGELGATMWSVFFLVNVGRAGAMQQLAAQEVEEVFGFLYDLSGRVPFGVRTTAAPHYRRFVLQQQARARRARRSASSRPTDTVGAPRVRGVTDGNGLAFVSHTGEVCPSGFLPLSGGSVRRNGLADIYRQAPLFRRLRDPIRLEGKCGVCDFRTVCSGSRARAYAATGNPMAPDPLCTYQPPRWVDPGERASMGRGRA